MDIRAGIQQIEDLLTRLYGSPVTSLWSTINDEILKV